MRDPDSARFGNKFTAIRGVRNVKDLGQEYLIVCGLVNGRNAYGGYTGFQGFTGILLLENLVFSPVKVSGVLTNQETCLRFAIEFEYG